MIKDICEKLVVSIVLKGERLKNFEMKKTEKYMKNSCFLPLLFNVVLEVLPRTVRQEKEIKCI